MIGLWRIGLYCHPVRYDWGWVVELGRPVTERHGESFGKEENEGVLARIVVGLGKLRAVRARRRGKA